MKYIWLLNSLPKDIVKILCIHLKQNQYIEDIVKGEAELSIISIPFQIPKERDKTEAWYE